MADRLGEWARRVKRDVVALYLASRDPRVPWYAKALAAAVAAYALSPIDLIPDAVPVLGYLDDALLLPASCWPSGSFRLPSWPNVRRRRPKPPAR